MIYQSTKGGINTFGDPVYLTFGGTLTTSSIGHPESGSWTLDMILPKAFSTILFLRCRLATAQVTVMTPQIPQRNVSLLTLLTPSHSPCYSCVAFHPLHLKAIILAVSCSSLHAYVFCSVLTASPNSFQQLQQPEGVQASFSNEGQDCSFKLS